MTEAVVDGPDKAQALYQTLVDRPLLRIPVLTDGRTALDKANQELGLALSDDEALKFLTPILNANDGRLIIISTPRGKNHLYKIFEMVKRSPEWFCQVLTLDDTKHIPLSMIQRDIDEGLVSEELVQQEYY